MQATIDSRAERGTRAPDGGAGIEVRGPGVPHAETVLTPAALAFVAKLTRAHRAKRDELLARRVERQARLDAGERPDFLTSTAAVRQGDWKVAPIPADLQDRRVEITGPVDRKMVINALNSGASTYMADFEDSHAPVWAATIAGQANLIDAVRRTISFVSPEGKTYRLVDRPATLLVRPRGWHLDERNLLVDGRPVPASLFDFGLYFFHNASELIARGSGPYFYLPKLESHLEARLWNDVFVQAQAELGLARGTIKATVLIETILAAFEMDEILHELREHSAGLNCGRWDYIFSVIKKFRAHPEFLMPDRVQVTMASPFLRAYSLLSIRTAHRRGAHAIGGMAAQIPIKNDPAANEAALSKVRTDKQREVGDGHDGTWVAHPGLVPLAREIFDYGMPTPNQIYRPREDVQVSARDLLAVPRGTITAAGLATNLRVAVEYLDAWLRGSGCVPLNNLMEDAATAEISRSQVWQWLKHAAVLEDGRVVTRNLIVQTLDAEVPAGRAPEARRLVEELVLSENFEEFLTLKADHRRTE